MGYLFFMIWLVMMVVILGMLVEGDIGKLSSQGTRYLGFDRN